MLQRRSGPYGYREAGEGSGAVPTHSGEDNIIPDSYLPSLKGRSEQGERKHGILLTY